ncbi:MAG: sugar phosphate isomerase/epimerase [Planctomycetota bacterium]|nr:MAG: sugar phosphate isomerase/epimerase [Planctomycetota bacterium]
MKTIQGPAIFLAQFMSDRPPFHTLDTAAAWAADLGFKGLQIPTWDHRAIDLEKAASSKAYCEDYLGRLTAHGLQATELSTHLQGQLVAVHPAYDTLFDGFAPPELQGKPKERAEWAVEQVKLCLTASKNLGLNAMATFSGALAWPYFYAWPQRPAGLVEEAFRELAKRWAPILDHAEECGVDVGFEIHPGEDLHDGATFERFLEASGQHGRVHMVYDPSHFVLQQLDYLGFIDLYHPHIKIFHVKDAEFRPNARAGVYGGYLDWQDRPGRFRSLGDGQVDFKGIFTKLARYDFAGWAVLEWECAYKDGGVGAREGAEFIQQHIIEVAEHSFDDFAASGVDEAMNKRVLGI